MSVSTMATHKITLPCQPPTLNELMRLKLRTRMRLSRVFGQIVAASANGTPKAQGKRRVALAIVLGKGQRGADPDAYFKAVGDALVNCGQLTRDDRWGVEWAPVTYGRGGEPGCVIVLEDL